MLLYELLDKSELSSLVYISSNEKVHKSADKVISDIILLQNDVINAFLIEWIDYLDHHTFYEILIYIKKLNKELKWEEKMELIPTSNGIFVTTYRNWVLDTLSDDFTEYDRVSGVYYVELETLNKYLLLPDVGHCFNDNLVNGTEYLLHCRYKSNTTVLRRMSCDKEVAIEVFDIINEALPKFNIGLYDLNTKDNLGPPLCADIIKEEDVLDPAVNLKEHIKLCNEINKTHYECKHILSELPNMI